MSCSLNVAGRFFFGAMLNNKFVKIRRETKGLPSAQIA